MTTSGLPAARTLMLAFAACIAAGACFAQAPLPPGMTPRPMAKPGPIFLVPRNAFFNDMRVSVLSLTTAKIDWFAYAGNGTPAKYQVWRDTTLVAEVPTTVFTFTDTTLRDNGTYVYRVEAIGSPMLVQQAPEAVPAGTTPGSFTVKNPLLGTSNQVSVRTVALLPPQGLTVSINKTNPMGVDVSWPAAANAQAYNVARIDVSIGRTVSLGQFTGPITDPVPHAGWYTYAVESVLTEAGGTGFSPPTAAVTIRVGPFNVLAFGDSVMWGQGLAESHKFTNIIHDWLSANLGTPIAPVTQFAHSGAHILPPATDSASTAAQNELAMPQPGEVPDAYPTITHQALVMGPMAVDPAAVDLILIDGCINDISIETILNPLTQPADLHGMAAAFCGTAMSNLLAAVHQKYPAAKIAVTGYFPIAGPQSDLTALNLAALSVGVPVGTLVGSLGVTGIDPVTGTILGGIISQIESDSYRRTAIDHSNIVASDSSMLLMTGVARLNAAPASGMPAVFALAPFHDNNDYASPQTWLWLVPTNAFPKDEVFTQRTPACDSARAPLRMNDADYLLCTEASMGHPNILGA